ncbi:MAG: hypothetical protein ACI3T9_07345 [Romboutsia timonensis]
MNKKNTLDKVRKVEGINEALKYLADSEDYITLEFDGSKLLGGLIQRNDGTDFTNDLSGKVPNGTMTRREQISAIFESAVGLAMADESAMPDIISTIADLYNMENGTDHDKWQIIINQVSAYCINEIYFQKVVVTFDRSIKTLEVLVQIIMQNSTLFEFHLNANLETHTVTYLSPLEPNIVFFLNTENTLEYEPIEDYNPATKKYVDDNCGVASVVYYSGENIVPGETDGTLDAQSVSILTIANNGKFNRKIDLGMASESNIRLDFKYTKPSNLPTLSSSDDMIEVNVEAFLYINDNLASVNDVEYNFYEDGTLMDGSAYLFQDDTLPTFEVGHKYQIFISYYLSGGTSKSVTFATIGVVDFGTYTNQEV